MSPPTLDLKSAHAWPLRVNDGASRGDDACRWMTARFNHKPPRHGVKVKVRPDQSDHRTLLTLQDGKSTYTYQGEYEEAADDAYVLYFAGVGKERSAVLQKLDSAHVYNMAADAHDTDKDDLLERYPQLTLADADDDNDNLFGDDNVDSRPVDADNPYDYRHYLNEVEEQHLAKTKENVAPNSRISLNPGALHPSSATDKGAIDNSSVKSPRLVPTTTTKSTSIFQNKRKTAKPNTKPQARRVKAGSDDDFDSTSTPNPAAIPRSTPKIDIPQVQLDRKASLQRPSLDDSGELILENETPISEKLPARHAAAMSLALSGQLGQGPISLRSAANSPAGRISSASPMLSRHSGSRNADVDIDMDVDTEGSVSPDELALAENPPQRSTLSRLADHDDELRAGTDDDIEIDLSSPAADEDDLDKQLALAFENDDDNIPGAVPANESEEESEEE